MSQQKRDTKIWKPVPADYDYSKSDFERIRSKLRHIEGQNERSDNFLTIYFYIIIVSFL